jgi:VIT1/CCC1 family predicted Fe2+/Mn2+ transporter
MRIQFRKGLGFGLTSGVITTLGLIVGLDASTESRFAVIAGILAIAVSDAFSDALGMHISEESTYKKTKRQIWDAMIATFFAKFFFALSFVIPFFIFSLSEAVFVCIIWGVSLISYYSYHLAKKERINPSKAIIEHVSITLIVVAAAYIVGRLTALFVAHNGL